MKRALLLGALAVAALGLLGVAFVRRRFVIVTVYGASMEPTIADGDRVLVRQLTGPQPAVGSIVAIAPLQPDGQPVPASEPVSGRLWLIKRVAAVAGDRVPAGLDPALSDRAGEPVPAGAMIVLGDNRADSIDSRHLGFLSADRVRGVVLRGLER